MKLFTILICILFLLNVEKLPAQYSDFYLMRHYFNKAEQATQEKKLTHALYYSQLAVMWGPDERATHIRAGSICLKKEYYSSAIRYYKEAIRLSESGAAYNNLAIAYGMLGEDDLTLETVKKGNETANKYVTPGVVKERQGKYDEAIRYMRKAMEIDTSPTVPLYNIGITYYETDRLDSALFYFNKTLVSDPEYISALQVKAEILKESGADKNEYAPLCKKIIDLISKENTISRDAYFSRGYAYKILGEKKKMKKDLTIAIEKTNELIKLYPRAYPFFIERAQAYRTLDNKDAAIADYKRAYEINPGYDKVKKALKELTD